MYFRKYALKIFQGFFIIHKLVGYSNIGVETLSDAQYMEKAIKLARKGTGFASPNPLVGSIIVKNNQIIGEGYHRKFGDKHAEIMAIDNASQSCAGATLYCNLEPCTENIPNKKTPPCTQKIIREKIKRVVISTIDPNPYVNGKGVEILKKSGINIDLGILANEAINLNEKYFKFIKSGLPFVHLKIAQSIDGRIATYTGNSKWITNLNALKKVHRMRSEYDAVLVGINTVLQDNPSLTVRYSQGRNPYRVILDNEFIIKDDIKLISNDKPSKTIIFTGKIDKGIKVEKLRERGIKIISLNSDLKRDLNLEEVLGKLAEMNISSVLVEGGGEIFTSFIKNNLYDKISIFISPIIIGAGVQSVNDLGITTLADAFQLENINIETFEKQILIQGYKDYKSILP